MKVIVTGVNGFVGHHVAEQLHEREIPMIGVGRDAQVSPDLANFILPDSYVSCDLTDPEQVRNIDLSSVSAIINLAGIASASDSAGKEDLYNRVNVAVHTTLLDECLRQKVSPLVLAISTGLVYAHDQALPFTEESRLASPETSNPYVASKLLMEQALVPYRRKGLRIVTLRPFNHTGPGQTGPYLVPGLGEQILEAGAAGKPVMVGNLNNRRDYLHAGDVAGLYIDIATGDPTRIIHDTYNVCRGKSTSGLEIFALEAAGFGYPDIEVKIDKKRLRPKGHDVMDHYGSSERANRDFGWEASHTVEETIADYVAWKKSVD